MNFADTSNLILNIREAINECYECGNGEVTFTNYDNDNIFKITADWIDDSKREGYSLMQITIFENGVVKFSYDDYGTECSNE